MGVPTWFDGELPNYWDEFAPALEEMDLTGKKIALFGLGDQKGYPENFLDGVGIMAEILEEQHATLVGYTSTEGYEFESSRARRGDQFIGLAIDYENQGSMNKERVANWVEKLRQEFST
jgi:flavodoxin I